MESEEFEELRHLWEDKSSRYVLIKVNDASSVPTNCVVYDLQTRAGLIIEDDDVAEEVISRMIASGTPTLSELPE